MINHYNNEEENILKSNIDDELLENCYKNLKTSEDKERIVEISMRLLSSDFKKQLKNIFIYETSTERVNTLIQNYNSIKEYILIINKMKNNSKKKKVLKEFIEIIQEKDNITDEAINLIKMLEIDDSNKTKINEILKSKETINKELIGV